MHSKEDDWKVLVKRLVLLRKQTGLSKKEMAQILEISVSTLNKIEKGELPPRLSVEILFHIQERFKIPPHELLKTP